MISIDADKGKFLVVCPYQLSHMIRDVPGRRWSGKDRRWVVPGSRKAGEMLAQIKDAEITPSAFELMAATSKPVVVPEIPFPASYRFKTEPMPHQRQALQFLWQRKSAALFMGMRTGKTKTTIDWLSALAQDGKVDRAIVICPLSIRRNWVLQMSEHAPIDIPTLLLDPSKPKQFDEFMQPGFRVLLVGVESLAIGRAMGYCERFACSGTVAVIVDESQKIKNPKAARTKNVVKLGRMTEYRAVLTGTPVANSPMDLYSQFEFLDPDIIGYNDYYSFRARYAIMGGYEGRQIIGYQNMEELIEEISPATFQVHTKDVADILPKSFQIREIELPESARALYKQIKKSSMVITDDNVLMINNALTKATRLHQLAGGQMTYGDTGNYTAEWIHDAKLEELKSVVEENPGPTIIWCAYRPEIEKVAEYLGDRCVQIHGGVSEDDRAEAVRRFQSGEIDYIVGNAATGGVGLTMNRAEMMIYYSSTFSAIDRQQSLERATNIRDGQKNIAIVDLVVKDTVDEIVAAALANKEDLATYVKNHIDDFKKHVL